MCFGYVGVKGDDNPQTTVDGGDTAHAGIVRHLVGDAHVGGQLAVGGDVAKQGDERLPLALVDFFVLCEERQGADEGDGAMP